MRLSILVVSLFTLISCASKKSPEALKAPVNQHMVAATVWFQTAAEVKALYYQGYNFAKVTLDQALKKKSAKKRAVVVDIDETVLDNSPYQAKAIQENVTYPTYWNEWIDAEKAAALPGAVEFLTYADQKGVEVFYISNRKPNQFKQTLNNLKKFGFPIKSEANILLQSAESNKTARRDIVSKTHNIVLLVGDNMNDFTGLYDKKSVTEKSKITDDLKADFGPKFIILPNPMYGDWESAVLNYDFKQSEEGKDAKRKSHLRSF